MKEQYIDFDGEKDDHDDYRLPETLANDLFRDYYQTFRLGQGETVSQLGILPYIAHEYHKTTSRSRLIAAVAIARSGIDRIMPPRQHVATTQAERDNAQSGFKIIWEEFEHSLLHDKTNPYKLTDVLVEMIARDIYYQSHPRPNRSDQDPHESIVREYILGDKLRASAELITVRDQMRRMITDTPDSDDEEWVQGDLKELRADWELVHPGQKFV